MDSVAKLDDIKNLIYETEGLIELAQQRTDKLHALLPLMQERVDKVSGQLAMLANISAESADIPEDPVDCRNKSVTAPAVRQDVARKPVFCLNDRFRFRRVIFGGSDADFNAAMDFLATLETYGEAEDYFYNDLGLDPAGEDVIEFMDVIKTYYGS